jgi:hypothetical protein
MYALSSPVYMAEDVYVVIYHEDASGNIAGAAIASCPVAQDVAVKSQGRVQTYLETGNPNPVLNVEQQGYEISIGEFLYDAAKQHVPFEDRTARFRLCISLVRGARPGVLSDDVTLAYGEAAIAGPELNSRAGNEVNVRLAFIAACKR